MQNISLLPKVTLISRSVTLSKMMEETPIITAKAAKVSPKQTMTYKAFGDRFRAAEGVEPCLLEKFHVTRLLIEEGCARAWVPSYTDTP